jgi:hypothetical protein
MGLVAITTETALVIVNMIVVTVTVIRTFTCVIADFVVLT